MSTRDRLVVFDALAIRALAINDNVAHIDELSAFRRAFQQRQIRILITRGILEEYPLQSNSPPQFQPLPVLNPLSQTGRAVFFDEGRLQRFTVDLPNLPPEHRSFVLDAIAGRASYFVTSRYSWLALTDQTEQLYNLRIVTPEQFGLPGS